MLRKNGDRLIGLESLAMLDWSCQAMELIPRWFPSISLGYIPEIISIRSHSQPCFRACCSMTDTIRTWRLLKFEAIDSAHQFILCDNFAVLVNYGVYCVPGNMLYERFKKHFPRYFCGRIDFFFLKPWSPKLKHVSCSNVFSHWQFSLFFLENWGSRDFWMTRTNSTITSSVVYLQ